ncbi:hypothetical protein EW146_g6434 [Bondarzewia mesenterica]|uniref:AB hydrolase-1 domain-containing protein n=1 Tax=Bondarzewia mesenterica TaxID=1095465 RepID=A0A4S4LNK0_9AGAM|nr:hypothetical protein EW146_g6434 [Bondarzewia mesenterica]
MIGRSIPELVFIRLSIISLRLIFPLSIVYLAASYHERRLLLSPYLALYALTEILFYTCVFFPRRLLMQKAAQHPFRMSQTERRELFDKCAKIMSARSMERWFSQTSSRVTRDNVTDWLLWALFSTHSGEILNEWQEELDHYTTVFAEVLGYPLERGSNTDLKTMRLTLDPVVMIHRPLLWYMIVGLVDTLTSYSLFTHGFQHFNTRKCFSAFPPRSILSLLSRTSIDPDIPYWYRPHRSASKLPILFIHGIGIGLWPYISFLSDVIKRDPDVGILVLEILPISMHITSPPIGRKAMCAAIERIMDAHSLPRVVVASHSYATLFVDPIPFLLHHPSVAYNFVYRAPRQANEWQLWYFASRDPDIAHALARHFFWFENLLWKEELHGRKVVVSLAENDQIVDAGEVRRYLTGEDESKERWTKDDLEVLFHPSLDHASVFDIRERWMVLIEVLHRLVEDS